jgi:hypothetical protein
LWTLCNGSTTNHIFCICHILEKTCEYNEEEHQLFIDFKTAYDSVRRDVFYSILIVFSIRMKLLRLIKMCFNETLSRVHTGKHLFDRFPIRNGLKRGDVLSPLFSTLP